MAREDCAFGFGARFIAGTANATATRDTVRRERIVANHRSGLFGSAGELADPSKVETGRCLPAPPIGFAQRDNWRANDGVVSALPEIIKAALPLSEGRASARPNNWSCVPAKEIGREEARPSEREMSEAHLTGDMHDDFVKSRRA